MAVVSIDWNPDHVIVACPVGPEQPPSVILPRDDKMLSGSMTFDRQGDAHLHWMGQGLHEANGLTAAVLSVFELISSPLGPANVWLASGELAEIVCEDEDNSQNLLRVGSRQFSSESILALYMRLVAAYVKAFIDATPAIKAVAEGPLNEAVCVIDPSIPMPHRACLSQALAGAGFTDVTFVSRWAAAAANCSGRDRLEEPCLVLDRQGKGFCVSCCRPSEYDCNNRRSKAMYTLATVSRRAIAQEILKLLLKDDRWVVIDEDQLPDQVSDTKGVVVTHEELQTRACELAACFLGGIHPFETNIRLVQVDSEEKGDFETRGSCLTESWQLTDERISTVMKPCLQRVKNTLAFLNIRHKNMLPETVCCTGIGFGLPEAVEMVEAALNHKIPLPPEQIATSSARGALLLPRKAAYHRLPYDCGILLKVPHVSSALGSLVVSRGRSLPCSARSKEVHFYIAEGQSLGVSIYLRKVDFGEGTVTYTTHGEYNLIPTVDKEGMFHLRADITVSEDGRIDVVIADLLTKETVRLEQMGILGGRTLASAPCRDVSESNGGLGYRMFERLRTTHYIFEPGSVSEEDYYKYLSIVTHGERQSERKLCELALGVPLPAALNHSTIAHEYGKLAAAFDDETVSDNELRHHRHSYLGMVLVQLSRSLLNTLGPSVTHGHDEDLTRLGKTLTIAESSGYPLAQDLYNKIHNGLTTVINRIETQELVPAGRPEIDPMKSYLSRIARLY